MFKLYESAVHKPVIVMIGLITLITMGAISAYKLPIEFLPRVQFPFIGVFVPYPNSHPEYIERNISKPLEEVMATLGGVNEIFSQSSEDGAFVGVEFAWGREVNVMRMEVKEKIDQIRGELPSDIEHMQLFTFNTNDIPILEGRISAAGTDLSGNYDLIERSIINPLKRIEGVGSVNIDGVEPKEIDIYLQIDKLKSHQVDVDGLFAMLQSANLARPEGRSRRTDSGTAFAHSATSRVSTKSRTSSSTRKAFGSKTSRKFSTENPTSRTVDSSTARKRSRSGYRRRATPTQSTSPAACKRRWTR